MSVVNYVENHSIILFLTEFCECRRIGGWSGEKCLCFF